MKHPVAILILALIVLGGSAFAWRRYFDRDVSSHNLTVEQKLDLQQHLRQGRELLRNLEVERAIAELDRCIEIDPACVEAYLHKARAVQFRDGDAAAEKVFAEVDRLDSGNLWAASLRWRMHDLAAREGNAGASKKAEILRALLKKGHAGIFAVHEDWLRQCCAEVLQGLIGPYTLPSSLGGTEPLVRDLQDVIQRLGAGLDQVSNDAWENLFRRTQGLTALRIYYAGALYRGRQRFREIPLADKPPAYSGYTLEVAEKHYSEIIDQSLLTSRECQLALFCLGDIAMRMGDYRSAADRLQLFLQQKDVPDEWQQRGAFLLGTVFYKDARPARAAQFLEPYARQTRDPQAGWLLHLMNKAPFPFRDERVTDADRRLLRFTEMAKELGIAKIVGAGPSAWGDVDVDGDLDLFVGGMDTFVSLYRNDDQRFTEISREAGLLKVASGFSSTLIDYDNDGDPDLYIGRNGWAGPAPNSLYRNDGGVFLEVTEQAGLTCPFASFVHSWADFNRDGWLDLYVANGISDKSNNRMYFSAGDGSFRDVTREAGLEEPVGTRTIGFAIGDYDKDGWPDLFVGGFEAPNRLYRNLGNGKFAEVARSAGVTVEDDVKNNYVSFFFDYDGDTWVDLLTTKQAPFPVTLLGTARDGMQVAQMLKYSPRLFRNLGDGRFRDVTEEAGVAFPHGVMGANIGDINNDGWFDVYFGTGGPDIYWLEMNTLLVNDQGKGFVDLTRFTGLGHIGKGHGVTFADPDEDGDLDLYAPQGGFEMGDLWPCAYYRNEAANENHWLSVALVGKKSNRMGIGAKVQVRAGDRTIFQEMKGGGGFGSCNGPPLHFGLADRKEADSVEIEWTSGEKSSFENVAADQHLLITEGDPEYRARPGKGAR